MLVQILMRVGSKLAADSELIMSCPPNTCQLNREFLDFVKTAALIARSA